MFVVGSLAARLAGRALALGPAGLRALEPGVTPDFLRLSLSTAENLLLRYGIVLGLAFLVGRWHRRRRLRDYGVTTAGRPLGEHLGIALLLFAAAGLLPAVLQRLADLVPASQVPAHWSHIETLRGPAVWLYLFVGSFGLVPIAEELLARGYIQSRLAEDVGPGAAILITAVFFTFSHTQYFIPGPIGPGMLVSLFIGSMAGGYVRHRTRSLVPVTIAHALGNFPFRGWLELAAPGAMVLLLVIGARPVYRYAVGLRHELLTRTALPATLAGAAAVALVLAQVLLAPAFLPWTGALALGAALILEAREPRAIPAPPMRQAG